MISQYLIICSVHLPIKGLQRRTGSGAQLFGDDYGADKADSQFGSSWLVGNNHDDYGADIAAGQYGGI